jgi:hypothetical protein
MSMLVMSRAGGCMLVKVLNLGSSLKSLTITETPATHSTN